ncbi:hypothetical protein BGZ49_004192 [Haplosporangium sp. Z 27]|nr:hypothetical protein BGZ49_004192 [Haplosporangium sp. Z 27]
MTSNIKLFCILEGDSISFSVKANSDATVDELKVAIQDKRSKNALANVDPSDLILFRVAVPDENSQVNLSNIVAATPLAIGSAEISEVFGTMQEDGSYLVELPKRTIHVIVQQPSTGISERQFLELIPPPTNGEGQADDGVGSDSIRRFSINPNSVRIWPEFNQQVVGMILIDTQKFNEPIFRPSRSFMVEADLHDFFSQDVGSVGVLNPPTRTARFPPLLYGNPDLHCQRRQDSELLFPIEMKRPYVLHVSNSTLPNAYAQQMRSGAANGPARPLRQILGYMFCNGFKYGVLTTYEQTWFIKCVQHGTRDYFVSPTIYRNQIQPTLLQSYMWFIRQANNDPQWRVDPPEEQEVEQACFVEDSKDRDNKKHDRSFKPSSSKNNNELGQTWMGRLRSSMVMAQLTEPRIVQSFEKLKLIMKGEGARTYLASWHNELVVLKKCDIWNEYEIMKELVHEARIYNALERLQGLWIPKLKLAGISNGIEFVLVTEHVGRDISSSCLTASECTMIKTAFAEIHGSGVCHGDIRPQNIIIQRDSQKTHVMVIDFGASEMTTDRKKMRLECEELERILVRLSQVEVVGTDRN